MRLKGSQIARRHYRITVTDALSANERAMAIKGRPGIVSLHLIESAIARPYFGYYPRIHQKAAALMESVVKNHGFADGNKRTAWILTMTLIRKSGYDLALIGDERIDDFVVAVAAGEVGFDDILEWFKARIIRAAD